MRENPLNGKEDEDGLNDSHETPSDVLSKIESLVLLSIDIELWDGEKGFRAKVLLANTGNNNTQRREEGVEDCKGGRLVLLKCISTNRN